jgi:hypothetical protein
VIRGLRVWDSHWAVALSAPSVLIDGLDIAHCDFGLWRPRYVAHAYRKLTIYQTTWAFYDETGTRPDSSAFPAPLDPVDDQPPVTMMTRVGPWRDGRLVVRGASADDGTIKCVRVNGQSARALGPNYSQWEVELLAPARGPLALTAAAEDSAGNVERIPHRTPATER